MLPLILPPATTFYHRELLHNLAAIASVGIGQVAVGTDAGSGQAIAGGRVAPGTSVGAGEHHELLAEHVERRDAPATAEHPDVRGPRVPACRPRQGRFSGG